MAELPEDAIGTPITLEISGVDEAAADRLRTLFDGEEEDVIFSHAFGGADLVVVLTTLAKDTLGKLVEAWGQVRTSTPKTVLKINKAAIEMQGFDRADIEALLASPAFQKAVQATRGR